MKLIPSFLLLAQAAVSLDPVHSDLSLSYDWMRDQDIPINDVKPADTREEGISKVMEILKANLTVAIDQAMIKLNSILLLKGHDQVSHGLFYKINQFKGGLADSFEDDLRIVTQNFKRANDEPISENDKYEFSESVKAKWENTLAAKLESFSNEVLPSWVKSVVHIWKGVENKVSSNIEKFRKFVHRSYPRSQGTCSLPKSILLGSNHLNDAFSPSERELTKRSILLNFIRGVIGGILLVIGSLIMITLYFVAYIVVGILSLVSRLLGLQNDDYFHDDYGYLD
jgi:hypothetical protein